MKFFGSSCPKSCLTAVLSSLLLFLSFPQYNLELTVWVGLVPLFFIVMESLPARAFFTSYLAGFLFFSLIFGWIYSVPGFQIQHHAFLGFYLGLFFAVFGITLNFVSRRLGALVAAFLAPALWVTLEFFRSNLFFMALPWALLAHSQHSNLPVIQVAAFTGAYGVSFLIVLFNSAVYHLISIHIARRVGPVASRSALSPQFGRVFVPAAASVLLILVLAFGWATLSGGKEGNTIRTSVLQGNIDQGMKGNPRAHAAYIMNRYTELTDRAAQDTPDLVVWPETSTPGLVLLNRDLMRDLRNLITRTGSHFLIGTSEISKFGRSKPGPVRMGNTALYISPDGSVLGQYSKIRLVPFGEYIPLDKYLGWPRFIVPDPDKPREAAGTDHTLFTLKETRFGVVICWEHVFPKLFRTFVKNGANFMLNITNEGWFGDTAAPHQMLAISIFRAVENRRPIARSANTGISGFIDSYGRVTGRVRDNNGKETFVSGLLTGEIEPSDRLTFYTQYGDVFAYLCILFSLTTTAAAFLKNRNRRIPSR
jgi:apolipoprotein N-acyltransferase